MMHVVLGDGEMTKRELSSTLEDLLEQAGDDPFWFLVQAKPEPTTTDVDLMTWLNSKEVYYEIIGDDLKAAPKELYANAQDRHEVRKLGPKVLELMATKPEEGEGADLLTLFVSNDEDIDEDIWLNEIATSAFHAGLTIKAMNDGLAPVNFGVTTDGEAEEAAEEAEEAPAAPKAAKKAANRALAAVPDPEPDTLDREALEAMDLEDVKAYAATRGITLAPRTRKATYIDHLLGEAADEPPEAEVEAPERAPGGSRSAQNGDLVLDTGLIATEVLQGIVNIIQMGLDALSEAEQ